MAESDDDDDDGVLETHLANFSSKKQTEKRKRNLVGKPSGVHGHSDDLIDTIVSNNSYKKKLIFTNTKNQRNGELYEEILKEVKARASARGEDFHFSVNQLRSKFTKCV